VHAVVEHLGRLDTLTNNAGPSCSPRDGADIGQWERMIRETAA